MIASKLLNSLAPARRLMVATATATCALSSWVAGAANVPISVLDTDSRRTLVTRVQVQASGAAELVDVTISEVPPRTNIGDPPQMRVESLDTDGSVIGARNAWDPLWTFVETETGDGEVLEVLEQALGVFEVPFDAAIGTIRILRQSPEDDGEDMLLISVDVSTAVADYCAENPSASGCSGNNSPPVAMVGGPYEVASGASIMLDATQSSDPDEDPLTFIWDLDEDGIFSETGASAEYGEETGDRPLFHAPVLADEAPRSIQVVVEVCDDSGACDSDSGVVDVVPDRPNDADGDGITDLADVCPATQIPESIPLSGQLGANRWALTSPQGFGQGAPQGSAHSFTMADTGGCSCEQILSALGIDSEAHRDKGCPTGLLVRWTDEVTGEE